MNFSMLMKRAGQFTTENSPTILTIVGVIGTVTTAYLAGKATWKVAYEIADYEDPNHDEAQTMAPRERLEFIKDRGLWREYIPPIAVGCATIACIIGANRVGVRRLAATAAAGTILERTFDEYKAKVKEKLGERKEDALHTEIAQDRVNTNPPTEHFLDGVRMLAAPDRQMCLDLYSGMYFTSSVEKIGRAINDFNHLLNMNGFGTLADFYTMLEIDTIPAWSENVGWNQDRLVEHLIDTTLVHETFPCLTLRFRNEPHMDYRRPSMGRY